MKKEQEKIVTVEFTEKEAKYVKSFLDGFSIENKRKRVLHRDAIEKIDLAIFCSNYEN